MFLINFSPNTVIAYVELAQLAGLGWELSSQRRAGSRRFCTDLSSSHPANNTLCGLRLQYHLF